MASRGQYGFLGKICSALASLVPNNALLWETIIELFSAVKHTCGIEGMHNW